MFQTFKINLQKINPIHLIILLALLQLFIALITDSLGFTHEEAMWHYIGRNWFRHGLIPYEGGVDNKSPFIFSVFGLSDLLFGVNYWFPRLVGTIVQSIGLFYFFKIADHIAGRRAAVLSVILYGLSLLWRSTGGKYVSFTETYAVTFIITAFYCFITAKKQKSYFLSGLLAGFGLGFRFSAGFGIIALLISCFRKNFISGLIFIAGVLSSIVLVLGIITLSDINLHNFFLYGYYDNFGSGSVTDRSIPIKLDSFANGFFYSELTLFYPFVTGYFFIKKRFDFLTIWAICEFIGIIILGIYARNHFKNLLPVFSLMSAILISYLIENYKLPFRQVLIVLIIVFFPKTWEPLFGIKKLLLGASDKSEKFCQPPYQQTDVYSKKKLGLWVKANSSEKDYVFIAGSGAQVQAYSERISPTIYFNTTQTALAKQRLFADLQKNKPKWILIPKFPEYKQHTSNDIIIFIEQLISKSYHYNNCIYGYTVYQLE